MSQARYPKGWDEARINRVVEHYETQSESEAVAEDEASVESEGYTVMHVPTELVPAVRDLIAKRKPKRP